MPESFVVYRSSAGSGKTYTLVKEYLLLALKNPQVNYRHILAITFTNKAMQEMKDRIISNLDEFIAGHSHDMKDDLMQALNLSEPDFLNRCKILQERILHEYSYFSISTIDAFFQKIIRSFTKELGLYGQYQLELNQDLVKLQAIDNLLAELKEDEDLTKWVVRFAEEQLDEGKSWDIRRAINEFASEIFKESFTELESQLPDAATIKEFQKNLMVQVKIYEKQLQNFGEEAVKIIEHHNLSLDDFKYKKSAAVSFLIRLKYGDYKEPSNRSVDGCTNLDVWVSKTDKKRDFIVSVAESQLMPLLSKAIEYYITNREKYLSAQSALKHVYRFGLLADLGKKVQEYKHDRDVLFIQDATRLIRALMKETDTPFIFEKVGSFYNHYLIDEFQDTSSLQWRCLHPLVFDTVSSGNKSMVVGDTKQSIYRWRGGDWSLLQNQIIKDLEPQKSRLEFLKTNYRSGGEIIDFNNRLFNQIPQLLLTEATGEIEGLRLETLELLKQINNVYNEAAQIPFEKNADQGYVEIQFPEASLDERWNETVLPLFIEKLEDLLSRGFDLSDIAVLVRKKDEAALLAQHLLNYTNADGSLKYPVLTNEALLIKYSRAVMIIINTFKYLESDYDQIALAELVYHHHKIFKPDEIVSFHKIFSNSKNVNLALLPVNIEKERNYLLHLPIEEAVEHLIRLYKLPGNQGEAAYLQTFQDKVLEFSRSEGNDINSFLQWWEEKGQDNSINVPTGLNAITVMTIHKAKGLQFPVVLVPFTSWKISSGRNTILWATGDEAPYKGMQVPVKYENSLSKTLFKDYFYKEKLQAALDSLNMLYVAFTRAEQELYAFVPANGSKDTIANYLLTSVSDEASSLFEHWFPQEMRFHMGVKKVHQAKSKKTSRQISIDRYLSNSWRDKLVVKRISPRSDQVKEKALRGTYMHHLLSKIKYKDDLITQSFFQSMDDAEVLKNLEEIINHPDVERYFSEQYEVLNEKTILTSGDLFRPDRVVVKDKEAVVIDYKWGEKNNYYKEQIRNYLHLLQQMGYSTITGLIYYVDQKSVERVV